MGTESITGNTPSVKVKKKTNKWKIAFFVLIAILIGSIIFVYMRITSIREPQLPQVLSEINQSESSFQVSLNKAQANAIVNDFLTDFQKDSDFKFEFVLQKQALFTGTFKVLGEDVRFYLYFNPKVEDNGDVTLKASSVSIEKLELPIHEILKHVEKNYKLPDWVQVKSSDNSIILHLSNFKTENGISFSANKFDLIDDEIVFTVYLFS